MDDELIYIFTEVLGFRDSVVTTFIQRGIVSVTSLLENLDEKQLERGSHPWVKRLHQKTLATLIRFIQAYGVDAVPNLTEALLEEFQDSENESLGIDTMLGLVRAGQLEEVHKLISQGVLSQGMFPQFAEKVVDEVDKLMSKNLKEIRNRFDWKSFLKKLVLDYVSRRPTDRDPPIPYFVEGQTQSGKSAVKGIIQVLTGVLSKTLVVMTKGLAESRELETKLQHFHNGEDPEGSVVCVSSPRSGRRSMNRATKRDQMLAALAMNGTIVLSDTASQIDKTIQIIQKFKSTANHLDFALVVDECDAMYRTAACEQKSEKAFAQLETQQNPCFIVYISATPVPLMIHKILKLMPDNFSENDDDNTITSRFDETVPSVDIPLFILEPKDEYVGFAQMKAIVDEDGNPIYLDESDLRHQDETPYHNTKVDRLFDDAVLSSSEEGKKGVLVLDCTCPRVYTPGNVVEKAHRVQRTYHEKHQKRIVVVSYTGKGIFVRTQPEETHNQGWFQRTGTISSVLDEIDSNDPTLTTPIFVFGFSKMRRGISYRSTRRVPTHYVMKLGRGHNAMNVVQTLGRATGNGKTVLQANGFEHVTVLSTSSDMVMAPKVHLYLEEVARRMEVEGMNFRDAMCGTTEKLPEVVDFLRHTGREIGCMRGQRREIEQKQMLLFEAAAADFLSADDEEFREKHKDNSMVQGIYRTLLELHSKDRDIAVDDLMGAFMDTFRNERDPITKKAFHGIRKEMMNRGFLRKQEKGTSYFRVTCPSRLRRLVNDELALTDAEVQGGCEVLEDVILIKVTTTPQKKKRSQMIPASISSSSSKRSRKKLKL